MALLQISEPGMAPAPHQRRLAVGIDLGTTNSLVAAVRSGIPDVLPDEDGHVLLPSVVRYLEKGGRRIGRTAKAEAASDPRNTIVSVKRFMGRGKSEVEGAENAPYDFVDAPGMVQIRTVDGVKSPVEVSAEILATLRQRAEDTLGDDLVGAVITVPAYFDEAQRQATKDAARLAGLNVLRLLNEPTAAAIAYGLDNGSEGLYAVYDLGGGTFDLSILKLTKGVFEVLAAGGDSALGGDDFDHALYRHVLEEAGIAPKTLAAEDVRLLLDSVRVAKEALVGRPAGEARSDAFHRHEARSDDRRGDLRDHHAGARAAHAGADEESAARRQGHDQRNQGRGAGGRRDPHAGGPPRGGEVVRPAAVDQSESRSGGRARRGDSGRSAGRQSQRRR